jgi:hypothetical protein
MGRVHDFGASRNERMSTPSELNRNYDGLTARCCKMQLRAQRSKMKLDARISIADHSVQ